MDVKTIATMIINVIFFITLLCQYADCKSSCKTIKQDVEIICDCSSGGYRTVPRNIPKETTVLDLSNNDLTLIKNMSFYSLTNLNKLIMHSSGITFIEVDAFYGPQNLTELDLSYNFVHCDSLPRMIFRPIANLKVLDLSSNLFHISTEYPDNALRDLAKLEKLIINGINGATFGEGFRSLVSLTDLILSPCDLKELKNDTFVMFKTLPIKVIRFSCNVRRIQSGALEPFDAVQDVSIVKNELIRISDLLLILTPFKDKNLTRIDLSENYLSHTGTDDINPSQFSHLGNVCVQEVYLQSNQISVLKTGSISSMKYKNCIEILDVSGNSIYGDIGTLFEIYKLSSLKVLVLSNQRYDKVMFTSKYLQSLSFPLPPKLERLYASKLSLSNTGINNITLLFGDNLALLDFNWTPFTDCKGTIQGLNNLQTFKMSGFNCAELNPAMISSFKQLRTLESASANLNVGFENDQHGMFLAELNFLQRLNISGNFLKSIPLSLFKSQYKSLCSVDLSNNKFKDIPFDLSKFLQLEHINLMNNEITFLEENILNNLDDLNRRTNYKLKVLIDGNTLQCSCNSIVFINWLFQTNITLDNDRNYSCVYIDGTRKTTAYVYKNIKTLAKECISQFWLILSVCLTVLLIIVIIITSIAHKYRITLQYWYLNIRRKYRLYSKLNDINQFKYDAFVAYHNDNYRWVCGPLVHFLENEKNLSLCLHDRDFKPGMLIADNIFDAISQSKKIILVVGKSFLESTWCEYELDMARMRMFRENRELIIIILLEKISTDQMPTTLLRIWNKITCLEADETIITVNNTDYKHIFWSRLYESIVI